MGQVRHALPNRSNVIDHLENNSNQKKMLQLLMIGSKSDDVDIALFCHVAKYVETDLKGMLCTCKILRTHHN